MDGVAVTPLTVDFHEGGFRDTLTKENNLGFWFHLSDDERGQHGSPMGPAQVQALNRYSYVLNNPMRYTDPTGHMSVIEAWQQWQKEEYERIDAYYNALGALVEDLFQFLIEEARKDIQWSWDQVRNYINQRVKDEQLRRTILASIDAAQDAAEGVTVGRLILIHLAAQAAILAFREGTKRMTDARVHFWIAVDNLGGNVPPPPGYVCTPCGCRKAIPPPCGNDAAG